jgi:creatinine amidohydrolase/Fe(II)-dependent formamide hydrolase-like protein
MDAARRRRGGETVLLLLVLSTILCGCGAPPAPREETIKLDDPRPIAAVDSLWTEELTWMEVRDAIKAGKTTIIVGAGGIEQNGPYVATGKHNYMLQAIMPVIGRKLGNALLAPIVRFSPEGDIDRRSGDMAYPGTIGVEDSTFVALITDVCRSYKQHGFTDIVLIGDHGGTQPGMKSVATELNKKWAAGNVRVHFIPEYYDQDIWSFNYLKEIGVFQQPDIKSAVRSGIHDDYHYDAVIATVDATHIRAEQRLKENLFTINGVDLHPLAKTVDNGRKLIEYRAGITADAIRKSIAKTERKSEPHRPADGVRVTHVEPRQR